MAGPDRYVRNDIENVTVTDLDVYKMKLDYAADDLRNVLCVGHNGGFRT